MKEIICFFFFRWRKLKKQQKRKQRNYKQEKLVPMMASATKKNYQTPWNNFKDAQSIIQCSAKFSKEVGTRITLTEDMNN